MAGETKALAQFAAGLRYEDIPALAVAIAKACIVDTVGVVLFGSTMPWSKIVDDYVQHVGTGRSSILDSGFRRTSAPGAAFANGAFAHAFEFDNLRQPSTGVHPGATVLTGALAAAEEAGVSGKDLITAFVAGLECMFRVRAGRKELERKTRLSRAGNHRRVRIGGRGQQDHEANGRANDDGDGHRRLVLLRPPGVREIRPGRHGETHSHGPRRGRRRDGGEPRRARF